MSRSVWLLRVARSDRRSFETPVVDQVFDGVVSQKGLVSQNDECGTRRWLSAPGRESVQATPDRGGDPFVGIGIGNQLQSRRVEVPAKSSILRPHDSYSASKESTRHGLGDGDPNVRNQGFPAKWGKQLVAAETETLSRGQHQGVGRPFAGRQVHVTPRQPGPDPTPCPWRMCNRV